MHAETKASTHPINVQRRLKILLSPFCVCIHVRHSGGVQALRAGTHSVHVYAVGVGPGVLEVFLQPLAQGIGDLVEADELPDPQHLGVVPSRPRVQTLDDGRNIPKDAGVHQCYGLERRRRARHQGTRGEATGEQHKLDQHLNTNAATL